MDKEKLTIVATAYCRTVNAKFLSITDDNNDFFYLVEGKLRTMSFKELQTIFIGSFMKQTVLPVEYLNSETGFPGEPYTFQFPMSETSYDPFIIDSARRREIYYDRILSTRVCSWLPIIG